MCSPLSHQADLLVVYVPYARIGASFSQLNGLAEGAARFELAREDPTQARGFTLKQQASAHAAIWDQITAFHEAADRLIRALLEGADLVDGQPFVIALRHRSEPLVWTTK